MTTVAIIDYGSGNLHSAAKAFERATREGTGAKVVVTADPDVARAADRIVLPGVGAFGDCAAGLAAVAGMREAVEESAIGHGRPFLGICVGMQLMASRGLEHGETPGFGWIPGDVSAIPVNGAAGPDPLTGAATLRIPHMGWNELDIRAEHPLLAGLGRAPHAYFVHSYRFDAREPAHVLATVDYGTTLAAVVGRDNLAGTQFHPEKSQAAGLRLIANFLAWRP